MKIDPRTKLFLVIAANSLILTAPFAYSALMVAVPAILLLFERKWRFVLTFFSAYLAAAIGFDYLKNMDVGMAGTLVVATLMLMYRMMPICVVFYYIATTTKVNEFLAGMSRMHVPSKITIPMTVMIRFFPTVFDEARAISNAMKMRGIHLFSWRTLKNPFVILEYKLIPLLVSLTKIGDELSIAASTRGLSPEVKRTCIVPVGFHMQDVVVWGYCIAVIAMFVMEH